MKSEELLPAATKKACTGCFSNNLTVFSNDFSDSRLLALPLGACNDDEGLEKSAMQPLS
jgi:hypothetical protein